MLGYLHQDSLWLLASSTILRALSSPHCPEHQSQHTIFFNLFHLPLAHSFFSAQNPSPFLCLTKQSPHSWGSPWVIQEELPTYSGSKTHSIKINIRPHWLDGWVLWETFSASLDCKFPKGQGHTFHVWLFGVLSVCLAHTSLWVILLDLGLFCRERLCCPCLILTFQAFKQLRKYADTYAKLNQLQWVPCWEFSPACDRWGRTWRKGKGGGKVRGMGRGCCGVKAWSEALTEKREN